MHRSIRLVLAAQVNLVSWLLVCILLSSQYLLQSDEGGISNYGAHVRTVLPYSLAFLVSAWCVYRAGRSLPVETRQRSQLVRLLSVVAGLYVVVLGSTYLYQRDSLFRDAHAMSSALLAVFELATGLWLVRTLLGDWLQYAAFGLLFTGFMLGVLTAQGWLHLLFVAEFTIGSAYGVLLVRAVRQAVAVGARTGDP